MLCKLWHTLFTIARNIDRMGTGDDNIKELELYLMRERLRKQLQDYLLHVVALSGDEAQHLLVVDGAERVAAESLQSLLAANAQQLVDLLTQVPASDASQRAWSTLRQLLLHVRDFPAAQLGRLEAFYQSTTT